MLNQSRRKVARNRPFDTSTLSFVSFTKTGFVGAGGLMPSPIATSYVHFSLGAKSATLSSSAQRIEPSGHVAHFWTASGSGRPFASSNAMSETVFAAPSGSGMPYVIGYEASG